MANKSLDNGCVTGDQGFQHGALHLQVGLHLKLRGLGGFRADCCGRGRTCDWEGNTVRRWTKGAYVVGCVRTGNLDAACNAPAKPLGVVVFVEAEAKHP